MSKAWREIPEGGSPSTYDLFAHRHNFAVWAAARATQRGFATVASLKAALEACGVVSFLSKHDSSKTKAADFDCLHRRRCKKIVDYLNKNGVKNVTYGRAAKLVAVYLKSMVICGPMSKSKLARVAHPPIDRILLQNLSRADEIASPHKREWARLSWTKLDSHAYYRLIDQLQDCLKISKPMWRLERYWSITN